MNRRVSPCGLRGGIGGHQGASWTPLGDRRASVMRCPVSQRWTSGRMSQMRLHPVSQACGHVLRPASSECIQGWDLTVVHRGFSKAQSSFAGRPNQLGCVGYDV